MMNHRNHIIELFTGYSHVNKEKRESKANCSVTLIKGENKIILVRKYFHLKGKKQINQLMNYIFLIVRYADCLG